MENNTVHLVCSSGGVKCFSYLGAIQKLAERNIEIASVSACSMGTVLSALICSGMELKAIEESVLKFDFAFLRTKKRFSLLNYLSYPFATHRTPDYGKIMVDLLGRDMTLGEMKIPLSVAALDLRQKRFLVYSSATHPEMKISEIVRIATCIPLFYEPYKSDKRLLVDAAVASESPVWIAAGNPGFYPILVLKTAHTPNEYYRKNIGAFLSNMIAAVTQSHDYFTLSQTPRSIEVVINCEEMEPANFNITREQIENMILQGQAAMDQKLRELNYNLNNIMEVEEMTTPTNETNQANRAEALATQMIAGFQNEIMMRNQVFVSYSHSNRPWMLKLQTQLKSIERFTGIKTWDDTRIQTGTEWNREIERALQATRVAVFLVTPEFLASDFIQDKEMKYFLEISERESVPIVWVAVSSSLYELTPLVKIQCANKPDKPLDQLTDGEQNAVFTEICKNIVRAMDGKPMEHS